ncbi:DUF2911 domain-containing protein [Pedobacter arcticus]|uniref:DUF2911 domain-containing protein n=1 Tax=Pedobacter arcticus TaxID=752140 RepID=UPI000300F0D5|nr:DUF2911 domain-containing protein [Pedobacter arcticus]
MKLGFKILSVSFLLTIFAASVYAQALMPQPSSGQTIVQDFGLGKVTVNYSRPVANGRVIFGGLVPYNEIWRTGANSATTIVFTDEVNFGGQKIAAGEYALFTIPGESEWTVVLNKAAKQWGAYTHKDADDVAKIKVKAVKTATKTETFTIQFDNVTPGTLDLTIAWDHTQVNVPLTVDYDAKVMANIAQAMKGEKKPYFAAAQYYFTNDKDLKQALAWVKEAEKADTKAPWIKLWKARIQSKMGDKKGAKISATEGLAIAKEINNSEYVKLNQAFINDLK